MNALNRLALIALCLLSPAPAFASTPVGIAAGLGLKSVDRVEIIRVDRYKDRVITWYLIHFRNDSTARLKALGLGGLDDQLGKGELRKLRGLTGEQLLGLGLASKALHEKHRDSLHQLLDMKNAGRQGEILSLLGWLRQSGIRHSGLAAALQRGFWPGRYNFSGAQGLAGQLHSARTLWAELKDTDPIISIGFEIKIITPLGERYYDLVITTKSGRKIFVEVKNNENAKLPTRNTEQIRRDLSMVAAGKEVRYLYSPNQASNLGIVRDKMRGEWKVVRATKEVKKAEPDGTRANRRFNSALARKLVGTYARRPFSRAGDLVD